MRRASARPRPPAGRAREGRAGRRCPVSSSAVENLSRRWRSTRREPRRGRGPQPRPPRSAKPGDSGRRGHQQLARRHDLPGARSGPCVLVRAAITAIVPGGRRLADRARPRCGSEAAWLREARRGDRRGALESIELGHVPVGARAAAQPRRQLLDERARYLRERPFLVVPGETAAVALRDGGRRATAASASEGNLGLVDADHHDQISARKDRHRPAAGSDEPEIQGVRIGQRALALCLSPGRVRAATPPERAASRLPRSSGTASPAIRIGRYGSGEEIGGQVEGSDRGNPLEPGEPTWRPGRRAQSPCRAAPRDGRDRAARSGRAAWRGRSSELPCPLRTTTLALTMPAHVTRERAIADEHQGRAIAPSPDPVPP